MTTPTTPSLSNAFAALGKALKVPPASAFSQPSPLKPAVPSLSGFNFSTAGSGTSAAPMSVAPNASTPSGPKYFPPPAIPATPSATQKPATAPPAAPAPSPAPVDTSSFTPEQLASFNAANALGSGVETTGTAPALPAGYARTPSGAVVNPSTGSLVSAAPGQQGAPEGHAVIPTAPVGTSAPSTQDGTPQGSAPQQPGTPATPTLESAFQDYLKTLQQSPEEAAAEANLAKLNEAASTAYVNTQNQPIALPFITGQQAALQRSQSNLARPLESQIALLQAKRTMAENASKATLDFMTNREKSANELATKTISIPFGGSVAQFNPATGAYETVGGSQGYGDAATQDSWVNLIQSGKASLSDVPQQIRQGVAEALNSSPTVSRANQDAISQADTVIGKIDEILPSINNTTAGVASYLAGIKGTPQYDLAAQIDTIKANVGFQALQAMRNASPTGGALGQVSEMENRLLQSTLASLDQGQSPDQLKANLAKVKLHFENLKKILSAPPNSQSTYDKSGAVVITPPSGAFGGAGGSGNQGGSIYDF